MTELRQRMLEELQRRNFSPDTIRSYIRAVRDFAAYFHKPPDQFGVEELRQFQLYMLRDRKLANLEATGAREYVSANVGCIGHLQSGTATPVSHWIELVDRALAGVP